MKNVALFVYDITLTGGAEQVALNMATEFSSNYNVHLISLFKAKAPIRNTPLYITSYLAGKPASITTHLTAYAQKLRTYLKQNNIDILFSITAGVVTISTLAVSYTKIKHVYCEHSNLENRTYGKKHELRQWIGAKFADKTVTLTERDRINFIKQFKILPEHVCTIPNWVSFIPNEMISYNLNSNKIITAGRLETVKGHDLLLKVAEKVYRAHPDWHWDIYGEGTLRQQIQDAISQSGLTDFISLKGNVNNLQELYPNYAMFILTSYYEGLPLVLLEAQNANLPIVSFDCPTGPSEIVEDNINGYIIPTYDIDQMANAVNKLIETPELRKNFSDHATQKLTLFQKDSVVAMWFSLMKELIVNN